ncbi:hypothetical protein V5O48_014773, partial [Marasmius crinis-equi]
MKSATLRSPNPLHWPELYDMAIKYVKQGDDETFLQFKSRLSKYFVAHSNVQYKYDLLCPLFECLFEEGANDEDLIHSIEKAREVLCHSSSANDNADSTVLQSNAGRSLNQQEPQQFLSPPPSRSSPPLPPLVSPSPRAPSPSSPSGSPTADASDKPDSESAPDKPDSESSPDKSNSDHPPAQPESSVGEGLDRSEPRESAHTLQEIPQDSDGDTIPTLPLYLQYGSPHINYTNYASEVKNHKFPDDMLLYLQTVPKDKQERLDDFKTTVLKWYELEGVWSSLGIPQKDLDKKNQPVFVTTWFKEGRVCSLRTPKGVKAEEMEDSWWKWWIT